MPTDADVAVVIPTYQRLESCRTAIRSALTQTLPPREVIVCDDGSSDRTEVELQEWTEREPRLQYFRSPVNTRTPATMRNLALGHTSSEWVAFLDDDDRWLPDKLERQHPFFASAGFDVVAGNALRSTGGLYFPEVEKPIEPDRASICRDNPIIISSAVVRRSRIEAVGGFREDPGLAAIADYCLWLALADAGSRFLVLPDPVLVYESGTDNRLSESLQDQRDVALEAFRRWRRRPTDPDLAAGFLGHVRKLAIVASRRWR